MNYRDIIGYFDFEEFYTAMVKEAPSGSVLVEVGCWRGKSIIFLAEQVIKQGKDIRIFAVDTWRGSAEQPECDQPLLTQGHYGLIWNEFLSNIRSCGVSSLITPMCLPSVEAARYFEDGSAQLVFIDALHTYESVKNDIAAWLPKVKKGGVLAGHDYGWKGPDRVKKAVDESFQNGIELWGSTWARRIR